MGVVGASLGAYAVLALIGSTKLWGYPDSTDTSAVSDEGSIRSIDLS